MWTDKCFRLILNTQLFEKMQIDRANKKSIRFNAMDNGVIRVFLMKVNILPFNPLSYMAQLTTCYLPVSRWSIKAIVTT